MKASVTKVEESCLGPVSARAVAVYDVLVFGTLADVLDGKSHLHCAKLPER